MQDGLQTLAGKRILVSGGTTGIGRAVVKLLIASNAKVMFFARTLEDVERAEYESDALGIPADVASKEDCERIYDRVDAELGGLDALINNAGIGSGSVLDTTEEDWHYALHVDLIGPMRMAALAVPRLMAAGGGHIVNVGSMSAKTRDEGSDVYVAAKMGLRGFSDSFGRHLAERNINVTLVEPGRVQSDLSTEGPERDNEKIAKGELLEEEDIARSILFILAQPPRCTIPMIQVRPRMQLI